MTQEGRQEAWDSQLQQGLSRYVTWETDHRARAAWQVNLQNTSLHTY